MRDRPERKESDRPMTLDSRTRWLALIVLCLGSLMIVLDTTIVNVALPSIRDDLGFSADLARVGRERLPADVRRLPAARRPARRPVRPPAAVPGRHHALHGRVARAAASRRRRGCSIAARAVQGVGGAIASAVALSLMMTLFTEPAERAKAMGVFGFVASGGGSIGVLLGGVLTDTLDWHWIFLVNIPIGIAVVAPVAAAAARRGARPVGAGRLDVAGAVTVTAALMLAVYAIVNGNQNGWTSAETLGLLAGAVALLAVFLVDRVARRVAADAAAPVQAAQRRDRERRRRALGRRRCSPGSSCRRSTCSSCSATARSQVGLAFLPANLIMGALSLGVSAKLVMRFGIRSRSRPGCSSRPPGCCCSRARRSTAASSSTCSRA